MYNVLFSIEENFYVKKRLPLFGQPFLNIL